MSQKNILIIEDNRSLSVALSALAERCHLAPEAVPTLAKARHRLAKQCRGAQPLYDFVLLDIGLPDGHGLDLLSDNSIHPDTRVAIISAHGEIENAITARKLGAAHFFDKPVDFESLENFLTEFNQGSAAGSDQGQEQQDAHATASSPPFIGASAGMRRVFQHIAQACVTRDPVVLRGQLGTGKSHAAKLIQANTTPRHCSSFISTTQSKPEDVAMHLLQNTRSTLLVENIEQLPIPCQQQLLVTMDKLQGDAPRLLATVDELGLHRHSQENRVLPELYYRLQVLEIHLPPLKERTDDIPALASYFLGATDGARSRQLSPELIVALQEYTWPGNLRELRNLMHHLVLTHAQCRVFRPAHLPRHFFEQPPSHRKDLLTATIQDWVSHKLDDAERVPTYKEIHSDLEGRLLTVLMERYGHKPSHLARMLRINRSTLRKKLNDLG